MGVLTALSAIHPLLTSLQNPHLKEILSIFGHESHLDDLRNFVTKIQSFFLRAETKVEESARLKRWIEKFEDAILEAREQLEKFVSLASQKQILETDDSLSVKVRRYYYRFNLTGVPYKVSQGVGMVRRKLDALIISYEQDNVFRFGFGFDSDSHLVRFEHDRKRRPETCSFVNEVDIIGRKQELEEILGKLFDPNVQDDLSFLSIVGMGGLGKTAFAQLVFNDERIKCGFSLRLWICVADQDKKKLNMKEVLGKILEEATSRKLDPGSTLDQLQSQLRQELAGKKYLLVLDDVWIEKPNQLRELANYLKEGGKGSWIMMTTRLQGTATAMDSQIYQLQGLSEENSRLLFHRAAFGSDNSSPPQDLVEIGQKFVDYCAGNPLAIRVVGSILYGQAKTKWQYVLDMAIAGIESSEEGIMPTLKLSYYNLESPLKSCFSYCALFPKDFTINMEILISLWMAHDYVIPHEGQSIEEAGAEYFSILLSRSFFQDIQKDKYGEIESCKIQDHMHDLAQNVTRNDMHIVTSLKRYSIERVRHVSVTDGHLLGSEFVGTKNILSCLHVGYNNFQGSKVTESSLKLLLQNCNNVRALDLSGLFFKSLPDSIGELSKLRYLSVYKNAEIEVLPKTLTKLQNLQTLMLQECCNLKELPKDLSKLTKLRHLNIKSCSSLTCLPRGIGKLTRLTKLSDFMVGDKGNDSSWKQLFDSFKDLKPLDKLEGHLNVKIWLPNPKYVAWEDARNEGLYPLKNKKKLKSIEFNFKHVKTDERPNIEEVTALMKELQPPSYVKYVKVWRYNGVRIGWNAFPSYLVELVMVGCSELEYLPCLGNLPRLKVIQLSRLEKLQYIGVEGLSSYYSSLETLQLENLLKLKGWRRGTEGKLVPCFPRLKSLIIWNCPELTCIPHCPTVEDLKLVNFNSTLSLSDLRGKSLENIASSSRSSNGMAKIKKVVISEVAWLNLLPMEKFQCLERLEIWCDKELETLGEVEKVFRSCSSSLRVLIIHNCSNVKSVLPGGLEHLTALEKLEFRHCSSLTLSEKGREETEDVIGKSLEKWSSNLHSLCTLTLQNLPKLENLPNWMQSLRGLQNLGFFFCSKLKSMPYWMTELTSLRQITISSCSADLERRCKEGPCGKDWPYIQHIQNIQFRDNSF